MNPPNSPPTVRLRAYLAAGAQEARPRGLWQPLLSALLVLIVLAAVASAAGGIGPVSAVLLAGVLLPLAGATPQLCCIDIRELRLPNRITLPLGALALGALTLGLLLSFSEKGKSDITTGLGIGYLALLLGAVFFMLLSLIGGLGMGDVKLGILLLIPLTPLEPLWGILLIGGAFLSAVLVGLPLLLLSRIFVGLREKIPSAGHMPFGPFLLFSFWLSVALWGLFPAASWEHLLLVV